MERTFTVRSLKRAVRPLMRPSSAAPTKPDAPPAARPAVIQINQKGNTFTVQPASDVSLLEIALRQGIPLAYKCKKERAAAVWSPSLPALTCSPRKRGANAKKQIIQLNGFPVKHR